MTLDHIEAALAEAGFTPRGAFHPEPGDGVPEPTGTLVLVGNAGPGMWRSFTAVRDPSTELIDDWTRDTLGALAGDLGCRVCFPFGGRPYFPFQRWARKAEPCYTSPLGILIHPLYGLWHGYRGALMFAERLELPPPETEPNPCRTCPDKPCLATCPVAAFSGDGYDVPACAGHLRASAGADCMDLGCRARRACPVGRDYHYSPPQARFHMEAFLRNHG